MQCSLQNDASNYAISISKALCGTYWTYQVVKFILNGERIWPIAIHVTYFFFNVLWDSIIDKLLGSDFLWKHDMSVVYAIMITTKTTITASIVILNARFNDNLQLQTIYNFFKKFDPRQFSNSSQTVWLPMAEVGVSLSLEMWLDYVTQEGKVGRSTYVWRGQWGTINRNNNMVFILWGPYTTIGISAVSQTLTSTHIILQHYNLTYYTTYS